MMQPIWLAGPLAALMIATAVYCTSRLVAARPARGASGRDVDLVHAVMGVSMGGMLVTRLDPLPGVVWAAAFGVAALWFGWQLAIRAGAHHVPHLVMCGAMVYMPLAATAMRARPMGPMATGPARFPLLALALALAMIGCVVWQAERLSVRVVIGDAAGAATGDHATAFGGAGATAKPPLRLVACCQIAMSLTMGYVLIMMV
jgi:hypothetical protein